MQFIDGLEPESFLSVRVYVMGDKIMERRVYSAG